MAYLSRWPISATSRGTGQAGEGKNRVVCAGAGAENAVSPRTAAVVFDFRVHFRHPARMETHGFDFKLRANAPEDQKRSPTIQAYCDETRLDDELMADC